jgi:hypothetical protein
MISVLIAMRTSESHVNEVSGSIKGKKVLGWLSNLLAFQKVDSAPWS